MKRRTFLKTTAAGFSVLAAPPSAMPATAESAGAAKAPGTEEIGPDDYRAPDWLRYARTVYFDGYTAPFFYHMKKFDARQLVNIVLQLGGDTLRFQPIGYNAFFPSKVYPVHPDLGGRDLIDEVSVECRKSGVHMYCYSGLGLPFLTLDLLREQPRFEQWIVLGPDGKPYARLTSGCCAR